MTDQCTTPIREEARAPGGSDLITEATETPRTRPPSLWRNRDYMIWWSGNAMSLLGSNVSNMAFPLLAIFTTGSVLNAGIIAAAGRIGGLLTLLWGGALADRRSRKVILVVAPALQAVLMGAVTVSLLKGMVQVNLLAGAALLSGLINGVHSGAVLPALRRIVPREQFAARAAQEQGLQMAAQLVGSPLAALLFSIARWLPFGFDAVSFLFSSLGALFIRHRLGPDREPPTTGGRTPANRNGRASSPTSATASGSSSGTTSCDTPPAGWRSPTWSVTASYCW